MIGVMFECPTKGEPLRTSIRFGRWPAENSQVTIHCYRCGATHTFAREHAIYAVNHDRRLTAAPR